MRISLHGKFNGKPYDHLSLAFDFISSKFIFSDCHGKNDPAPWFEACIRSECSHLNSKDTICSVLSGKNSP